MGKLLNILAVEFSVELNKRALIQFDLLLIFLMLLKSQDRLICSIISSAQLIVVQFRFSNFVSILSIPFEPLFFLSYYLGIICSYVCFSLFVLVYFAWCVFIFSVLNYYFSSKMCFFFFFSFSFLSFKKHIFLFNWEQRKKIFFCSSFKLPYILFIFLEILPKFTIF